MYFIGEKVLKNSIFFSSYVGWSQKAQWVGVHRTQVQKYIKALTSKGELKTGGSCIAGIVFLPLLKGSWPSFGQPAVCFVCCSAMQGHWEQEMQGSSHGKPCTFLGFCTAKGLGFLQEGFLAFAKVSAKWQLQQISGPDSLCLLWMMAVQTPRVLSEQGLIHGSPAFQGIESGCLGGRWGGIRFLQHWAAVRGLFCGSNNTGN